MFWAILGMSSLTVIMIFLQYSYSAIHAYKQMFVFAIAANSLLFALNLIVAVRDPTQLGLLMFSLVNGWGVIASALGLRNELERLAKIK